MDVLIQALEAGVEDVKILHGVDLSLQKGSLSVLMGPNGSGKSTIANVIVGNPKYEVSAGSITVDGHDLLDMEVHERARAGVFMSFQDPIEITGISVGRFLRRAYELIHGEVPAGFVKTLRNEVERLNMDQAFINRYLNEGFSGGEKKRMELLQARVLRPKLAIFDEIDSGLDIDAIRLISEGINDLREDNPDMTILIVTHYRRIIDHLKNPSSVHIMSKGKIVQNGDMTLLDRLEDEGYGWINDEIVGGE